MKRFKSRFCGYAIGFLIFAIGFSLISENPILPVQCFLDRSIKIDFRKNAPKREPPDSTATVFLKRYKENPLWSPENENKESYQLVLFSKYRRGQLIKTWEIGNNHFILIKKLCFAKSSSKNISNEPQICSSKHKIRQAEWQEFKKLVRTSCYWGIIQFNDLGKDGEGLMLEALEKNRYRAVYHWMPNPKSSYSKICSYLLQLSKKYS